MECIETKDVYNTILAGYSEDLDLIEKYHIKAGASLEECAKHNSDDLKDYERDYKGRFFRLEDKGQFIGFFGVSEVNGQDFLSILFIRPEFRKKDYMKKVWETVNKTFDESEFMTIIYKKNQKAKAFFDKLSDWSQELDLNSTSYIMYKFNSGE